MVTPYPRDSLVGTLALRGFDRSVGVHLLVAEPDRVLPAEIAQATEAPCVGRDAEIHQLVALLGRAVDGGSCAAVIEGEPGIGKSRLAAQVALEAHEAGFRVLYGRCEQGQGAPYGALVAAFGPWLAGCPDPLLARVAGSPRLAGLLRHLPDVATRVKVDAADESTDPQIRRGRALAAFCDLAAAVSIEQPMLLVVDDLHWAEASTALALAHLVEQQLPRFALLATTRGSGGDGGAPRLDLLGAGSMVLPLEGFSDGSVAAFIASRFGQLPPDDIAGALRSVTDGNPFFLDAWLSDPASAEQLHRQDGSWCSANDLVLLGVPQGVRGVVRRRVATLDDIARRNLQVGAVMGSTFDAPSCRHPIGSDLPTLIEAVERCAAVGLVREVDVGRFEFRHAIVRQTILDDMSRTLRATLHWRVGEALEMVSPERRRSEIAMHYGAGIDVGDPATAASAGWAAGDEATRVAAFEEAAAHYRMVLAALDRLPDDLAERYRALVALGRAQNAAGDIAGGAPVWLQAANTAQALADPARLFEAAHGYGAPRTGHDDEFVELLDVVLDMLGPDESPLKAIVLGWRAVPTAFVQAKRRNGIDHQALAQAVDMAERSGDLKAIATTLRSRSVAASHGPDAERMRHDLAKVADLGREHDLRINEEPSILLVELAVAELRLGHSEAAERALDEARAVARRNRSSRGLRNVAVLHGAMAAAGGHFDDAKALARHARGDAGGDLTGQFIYSAQVLAVRFEEGRLAEVIAALRTFEAIDISMRAWSAMLTGALADAGERAEAETRLDLTIGELTRGQQGFADQLLLRHLAETSRRLGDAAAADTLLASLEEWAGQLLVVPYGTSIEGAADRARGLVLGTLQRFDEADDAFRAAESLERTSGFHSLAARTAYWRAVTLVARRTPSDVEVGLGLLDDVADEATRLGMPRLAEQARTAGEHVPKS